MEAAAMQDKKAMCLNDIGRPKSCIEKFIQKWNEKQKLQQQMLSFPQMPECQATDGIPSQRQMTINEPPSLMEASFQSRKNAVYIMMLSSESHDLIPVRPLATENHFQQLSVAFNQMELDFVGNVLASRFSNCETNTEEEFLQICTSDLLLKCPVKKRPRLLPPDKKMHMEVRKKVMLCSPQDSARSPIPLEYSHLSNTMSITNPPNIPKVECTYYRFSSELVKEGSCRSDRQGYQVAESLSPAWGLNASPSEQTDGETDRMKPEQHQPSRSKRSALSLDLEVAAKQSLNAPQYKHLPPKKRCTRSLLQVV